ncbi:MAG TPA: HAMP domain-containing histidine kinase [Campylobacterales bacterium]|nr:HAMP domain-containing histidine kinase [Campylobacterales bacterium]
MTIEDIDLKKLITDRVEMIEKNYSHLDYTIDISDSVFIKSNEKALIRIVDNIIINASKYNKDRGEVNISYVNYL